MKKKSNGIVSFFFFGFDQKATTETFCPFSIRSFVLCVFWMDTHQFLFLLLKRKANISRKNYGRRGHG